MSEKNIMDKYTYRVIWSEEDNEYVGLCAEFPGLSWLAKSPEKAIIGIRDVVTDALADMKKNKESIPEPINTDKYSGKFVVRVTPELHKKLAIRAAEYNISLNRYVCDKLAC